MEDKALRASNVEVIQASHFFPDENTVPVEKSVLSRENADIFYDKSTDKLIIVPEETHVQGHFFEKDKVDSKLDEIADSMRGFGIKGKEMGSELNDKLSRSVNQTKEELSDLASRTTANIEDTASRVKESATEAKENFQQQTNPGFGFTDKLAEVSKSFTDKVTNFAESILGVGSNIKVEEPTKTDYIAEATSVRVDDQPSDSGAKLEEKIVTLESKPIEVHQVIESTAVRLDDQPADFGAELESKDLPTTFEEKLSDFGAAIKDKASEIGNTISETAEQLKADISSKFSDISHGKFENNVTGITDLGQGPVITQHQESSLTSMVDDNYMTSHRMNGTDLL